MKLKVYQQGGGLIYTPFIPGAQGTAASDSGKSSGGDDPKLDPLDKEIIALMKDQNLLPSDIQAIYNSLTAFQRRTQRLSSLGGTSAYRSVMPGMLQIMQMVSVARNNKERFDKSVQLMTDREAGGEVALDSNGYIWVLDKDGKISKISPFDYDKTKHQALSNSQVLDYRRSNPQFAFDLGSFETVGNNIVGMKQVQQEITDIVTKFGTDKAGRYVSKEFKDLAKQVMDQGYFKVTVDKTRSLSDLNGFAKLLWDGLGNNVRNLLTARAAMAPEKTDPISYLRDIVFAYSKQSYDEDFDANMTKASGGKDGTGSGTLKQDTYQIRFANGVGNDVTVHLVPQAASVQDKAGLEVKGVDFGPMLNFDQLPLEPMNLQKLLFTGGKESSALATSVRSTDITFGNRLLDGSELPAIMYNNESLTSKVYLPYREENGHFVPDFRVIQGFNKYLSAIKGKNLSTTEKNALLQQCGLHPGEVVENEDGTFKIRKTMPFLCFSAIAGDDTIKLDDEDKRYLAKVDRSKGRVLKDMYNNAITYGNVYAKKDATKIHKNYGKSEAGDFWEGLVFIPAPDSFYAYNSTSNQYVPPQEFNDVAARVWANNVQNTLREEAQANPNYNDYSKIGQF